MDKFISLVELLVLLAAGYGLLKLIAHLIGRCRDKEYLSAAVAAFIIDVCRWIIIIVIILLGMQLLGVDVSHLLSILSTFLVLIAVGFIALWSVLTNILCGFLLLVFRPFRFGDVIELRDPEKEHGLIGKAIGLNLFYITLSDLKKSSVYIKVPNTMFFQRVIICHAGEDTEELKLRTVTMDQNSGDAGVDKQV